MPKVEITLVADDFRIFTVDLTPQELRGLEKVMDAYYDFTKGTKSGPYIPSFQYRDLDALREQKQRELRERLEAERVKREQEARQAELDAKRREEEHQRDVFENGAIAVAYRRALEKKAMQERKKAG